MKKLVILFPVKSPHAAALASSLFRKRVKPSGKVYKRDKRVKAEG